DLNMQSGGNDNDFHSCLLISDNGPGFVNPNATPVIISGFGVSKIQTADYNSSLAIFSQDPVQAVVQIASYGDLFPPDTCVKVRLHLESASPNSDNPGAARFFLDVPGTGNSYVQTVAPPSRLFGTGFGGVPIRVCLGIASSTSTTAPSSDKKCRWDNLRYRVATPYSVGVATCSGGVRNGCRVRGIGVPIEPDCNCNGVPDSCDVPVVCVAANGTAAAHPTPQTTQSVTTTRPCSIDCNSNGIPDECEVPVKQSRTVLYHDFEANTA